MIFKRSQLPSQMSKPRQILDPPSTQIKCTASTTVVCLSSHFSTSRTRSSIIIAEFFRSASALPLPNSTPVARPSIFYTKQLALYSFSCSITMEKIIMMKASRRAGVTTLLLGGLLALSSGSRVSALSLQARAPGSRSSAQPNEVDEREEDEECAGLSVYKKFTRGHPITGDDCLKGIGEFCNSFCSQPNKVAEARAQTGVQTYTDHGQEGFDPLLAAVEDVRPPPRRPTPASLTDDASSAVDEAGLGLDAAALPSPRPQAGDLFFTKETGNSFLVAPLQKDKRLWDFPTKCLTLSMKRERKSWETTRESVTRLPF